MVVPGYPDFSATGPPIDCLPANPLLAHCTTTASPNSPLNLLLESSQPLATMGVTVETTKEGDKQTYPKPGDSVTMDYTGTLEDGTVGVVQTQQRAERGDRNTPKKMLLRTQKVAVFLQVF